MCLGHTTHNFCLWWRGLCCRFKRFYLCVWVGILVWKFTYVWMPVAVKGDVRSFGAGVPSSYNPPDVGAGKYTSPLCRQHVLCLIMHRWGSEVSFGKSILSSHHAGPDDWTLVVEPSLQPLGLAVILPPFPEFQEPLCLAHFLYKEFHIRDSVREQKNLKKCNGGMHVVHSQTGKHWCM